MRFLADESCDFAVVRALKGEGYDVVSILENCPGAEDRYVIDLAIRENRILLTEDKDFGRLVYLEGKSGIGVVLLRFPAFAREEMCKTILKIIQEKGDILMEKFVVIQPGRIRIRRI